MNLSLFDNMVGPRQGRVTTIRVEFNMAAAIPQWPPVLCVRQQASASRLWTVRDGHTASLTVRRGCVLSPRYPAFLYLMLGTAFFICLGTGLYCRWYHKQRQPHRWYRRGHTLSSPRFEVGLNPFRNDRDLNAAGLSHAQNPPVEWHAYVCILIAWLPHTGHTATHTGRWRAHVAGSSCCAIEVCQVH